MGVRINPLFITERHRISGTPPAYEIGTTAWMNIISTPNRAAAIAKLQDFKQDARVSCCRRFFSSAPAVPCPVYYTSTSDLANPFPRRADERRRTASQSIEIVNTVTILSGRSRTHTDDAYRRKLRWLITERRYMDASRKLLTALETLVLANTIVVLWGACLVPR